MLLCICRLSLRAWIPCPHGFPAGISAVRSHLKQTLQTNASVQARARHLGTWAPGLLRLHTRQPHN